MKFIGLDVGDKRIGVAFGDSALRLATPVETVRRVSLEQDARAIAGVARKYEAAHLIVGLPRNMNGSQGAQAESVMAYAEKIAQAMQLPLDFWDERLSTVEATRRRHETSLRRGQKSRRNLDALAAALILQDFLDARGSEFK